ncbi:UNVERIFIED_CONTAM: hypothetical protein Sradi_1690300 [Sesamum radiatum]|uniref:Uncharacterized protein n=1 Tax=Sesamum radiatum TaxID=300843 RepID=A0AAW2UG74_SESRA
MPGRYSSVPYALRPRWGSHFGSRRPLRLRTPSGEAPGPRCFSQGPKSLIVVDVLSTRCLLRT